MEPFDLLIGEESALLSLEKESAPFERYMLRTLVLAYISALRKGDYHVISADFVKWYSVHAHDLGLSIPQIDVHSDGFLQGAELAPVISVKLPHSVLRENRIPTPPPSALQRRIDWVCSMLGLDAHNTWFLSNIVRLAHSAEYRPFALFLKNCYDPADIFHRHGGIDHGHFDGIESDSLGALLGISGRELEKYFGQGAPLLRFGLLENRYSDGYAPSALLVNLLRRDTEDPQLLERSLFGEPRVPQLTRADFSHLGSAIDSIVRLIDGTFAKREKGINILFHGDPGTGKTELATLLAHLCDARVVFAGEMDESEGEPSRSDRLTHLSLLSALGQRVGRTIVVVDEAEDIFVGVDTEKGSDRRGSKVFLNRLVETSVVPTIWITNHPNRFGDAVLRRMTQAVEFPQPGITIRRRIIDRHAAALDVVLDTASRDRLAQVPVAPAVIASALKAASLGGDPGSAEAGEMALASALSIHKVMTQRDFVLPTIDAAGFDAALSSADIDLELLEERVAAAGPGALSFLFTGLPGTGKSAFARHLARRLGMEVLEKRGSDLLGMYVGQTEANIAKAFREALDEHMFLVFDEADSLLADRRGAFQHWEVSQVNEMLTWMERHPLPFAATSNLLERLDPAVQRRFLFKARFTEMSKKQIAQAFHRYFNFDAPASVLKLDPLTPGDFVVVARKAKVLGIMDALTLGEMLKAEVLLKPGVREPVGFM